MLVLRILRDTGSVGPRLVLAKESKMSTIEDKYAALGGTRGFLGQPTTPEQGLPDRRGRHRDYQHGVIYWSPETGAHVVYGSIGQKWAELGREAGFLGDPYR